MRASDRLTDISLYYWLLSIFTNDMGISYALSILSLVYNRSLALLYGSLSVDYVGSFDKHMRSSDLTLHLTL